jgi:hypothetical protein
MPDYNDSYIELLEEHIHYERIFNEIYHIMLADDERIGRITS